ncbi:MAG: carbohydrate binding domain-containing protein [Sedimentisphaerales bacterium]
MKKQISDPAVREVSHKQFTRNCTIIISVIVLLFLFPAQVPAGENILTNPGFESGTTGWSGFGCSITTSSTIKRSGSYSGKAYSRTGTWNGLQQDMLGKMESGKTYTISGWMMLEGAGSGGDTIKATVRQKDSRDGNDHYFLVNQTTGYNGTWTLVSGSFTLNVVGTLQSLYLYFEGPASGVVYYLDDANVLAPDPPPNPNAAGDVNFGVTHQAIEGFGAAGAWYENWLLAHPQETTLYDILFRDLGLDIYRVRNCYGFDGGYINNTKQIVQAAKARNPSLKILSSAWSPPAYLKSNNDTNSYPLPGTLKKDANDPNNIAPYYYVYKAYAKWWADSLAAYESNNIHFDYICIQNEADWETTYESCKFLPTETSSYAGYDQAYEAVYQRLNSVMGPNMPKMLPPETVGFAGAQAYINALIDVNHLYGYAHHLYGDGDYNQPDSFIPGMQNFASMYGYKPLLQTEYADLSGSVSDFNSAMNMALHIHNSLVYEGVCSYFYWDLFWGPGGGLVTLPTYGGSGYTINPAYYIFKHYSKFTDPGWLRTEASTNSAALRISAFKSPDDSNMAIVIINTTDICDINLALSLGNTSLTSSEIYRSISGSYWSYIGTFNPSTPLLLPRKSITTIHLTGPPNYSTCAEVIAGNHRLYSDINMDCYVDIEDLGEFTLRWLRNDCNVNNNYCNSADIDFSGDVDFVDLSRFGSQWLTCNDPQVPECSPNW